MHHPEASQDDESGPLENIELTSCEIETGRKLFAGEWRFVAGAGSVQSLPSANGIEISFAGRSNVGKSSLLNALTGRRALARVSRTPGRTQLGSSCKQTESRRDEPRGLGRAMMCPARA